MISGVRKLHSPVAQQRFWGPPVADCGCRRWRSGLAFEKNVPKMLSPKNEFFDQKPVFNELFSKGRKFGFFKANWQKKREKNVFWWTFFIFCGPRPLSFGPPACGKCGREYHYPFRYCPIHSFLLQTVDQLLPIFYFYYNSLLIWLQFITSFHWLTS